ncbi:YopX family protein [Lacticaseibacillus paracasei]|uniref:YopX family protein n=1 Tax=Lacticaseibacillus paracasei TaxID=1597 RepID=UPI001C00BBAE|nr:YopX family protein [Lacticaseibacillus paracasei]MBT9262347.1 YopX family protein [Lacticaseibacillus paracasei]
MKREIKFRAYSSHNHRMYPVSNIEWDLDGRIWVIADDGKNGIELIDEEAHLMEYTGLHDKNGREIYEGDIVRTGTDNIGDPDPMIGQVIMQDGSWLIENEEKQEAIDLFSEITSREVIGNIFEDKQLLEGEHEQK